MTVALQTWADQSGNLSLGKLTKEFRVQAQPRMAFDEASEAPLGKALGKNAGATVYYDYVQNVNTAGGVLVETEEVPTTSFPIVQGSFTVQEFGNAIDFTRLLDELSELEMEHPRMKALMNDWHKLANTQAFNAADATDWQAAFNSSADEFVTNGTLTVTANEDLTLANLRYLVLQAHDNDIPYFDGESYLIITGFEAADTLTFDSDVQGGLREDSGRGALNGELGRVRDCRIVIDNHSITGNGQGSDEVFLLGADAIGTDVARPLVIDMESRDIGKRFTKIGYLYVGAWYKILDQTTFSREHIIKVSSA